MMLEPFYKNHDYLLEHLNAPVRRQLMDEINWNDRLIAIKGCRGVGKTTFLLQYAKERWGDNRTCLYVDCNNFHFAEHTLVEFASQFVSNGGRCLLIDQAFKYENWSAELHECYERFPSLQVVFSASPVMRLIEGNDDLQKVVKIYNLRGFSFREYLNQQAGTNFRPYTLQEILTRHEVIAQQIISHVHPSMYFSDYLYHGYYPFYMENHNFEEQLLKTMNMMIEVDILIIKQIDTAYLSKLRGLLYEMLYNAPCGLNVSKLAKRIDTSRATVMNYIKYLKDARLLNLLYPDGKQFPMKPTRAYMHNTNLLYTLPERIVSRQHVAETFFYNALHATHKVYASEREALFAVDTNKMPSTQTIETMVEDGTIPVRKIYFNVSEKMPTQKQIQRLTAVADIEKGESNVIPLWLFGFLY